MVLKHSFLFPEHEHQVGKLDNKIDSQLSDGLHPYEGFDWQQQHANLLQEVLDGITRLAVVVKHLFVPRA